MKRIICGGYDIETTGLLSPEHRIIEVAVMKYEVDMAQPELNRLISSYTQRINPKRSIDPKAFATHKISLEMLEHEPVWEDVAPTLCKKLNECQIVVGHNQIEFDLPFTLQELDRIGHPHPDFHPFDTMLDGRWATPFGKAPNLGELCFAAGIPYDPSVAHAASYDVDVMMKAFFFGWAHKFFDPAPAELLRAL